MMGRFISGWGVGGCSAAGKPKRTPDEVIQAASSCALIVPVYQSETVPKQLRGTLIATYQLMITAGILVAYCISIGTRELSNSGSWRIVIALGIFFALVLGVGIMFVRLTWRFS
jgi:SP family sugar:H+ symporter-like MFS transporter